MANNETTALIPGPVKRTWINLFLAFTAVGAVTFLALARLQPREAWQAFLANFLLFSAIAQGGLLFSTLMHTVRARWSSPLASVAEALTAFFPVSLILFAILFIGRTHLFPWLHAELHGKEDWLNIPFLFLRDLAGLTILYGLGLAYLYHALYFRLKPALSTAEPATTGLARWLIRRWNRKPPEEATYRQRMTVLAIAYMLAFALVLSLIGYDLVMSMDPHWYSTLFGAYSFVKAIYVGFGAIIILAALLHGDRSNDFQVAPAQFHDMGKLFFAFCLVWADFFYVQLVVIWYGNISEETSYVIQRTMLAPWNAMAWTVFGVCFIIPFVILLNRKIKTMPRAMILLCSAAIAGMWIEHFLLLRPAYTHGEPVAPLYFSDVLIMFGFLGLMASAVAFYLHTFPGITAMRSKEVA
jgi:Ni/Fe-hydrogenase subunit HybB-like protein